MTKVNQSFRNHVTGAAFALTLSGPMIRRLLMMDLHPCFYFDGTSHNLKTLSCLQERGLVLRHAELPDDPTWKYRGTFSKAPLWVLTDEGRLVVQLLKSAGFVLEDLDFLRKIIETAENVDHEKVDP